MANVMKKLASIVVLTTVLGFIAASPAKAERVKELASIRGVSSNALVGYGLVVGLAGTGDNLQSAATQQMMANIMSRRFGTVITPKAIRAKNVAVVMVTARLPPFSRIGSRIDVTVSSSSNAKSLFGGTLLPVALKGGNGQIYAWAEGALSVGGFAAGGKSGSGVTKNHPTVGRVPSGAVVGKELGFKLSGDKPVVVSLKNPDFTTAARIADAINARFGSTIASAPDPGTVSVVVPANRRRNVVAMIAEIENVEVSPDNVARIIINEKTGTVVMGAGVRLQSCAISHGGLTVQVSETTAVSQPGPLSGGETAKTQQSDVQVIEETGEIKVVSPGPTLGDVVSGLNALGVTPRDLVAILLAMKEAGALRAEIEVQ